MANGKLYYSREIRMPRDRREGLSNFVQIIINQLEAGAADEALLTAVDLLEDITSGAYDNAMADAKGHSAIVRELEQKHADDIIAAAQRGHETGVAEEKERMSRALGLIAA